MTAAALYAAITPHGYGHGAITVAVLNALAKLRPTLRLAVVGGPPAEWMGQRLHLPLALHDRHIDDPGMVNADSNTVLAADSLTVYRALFERFEAAVAEEMARQRSFRPDVVVSNIGFVPLEAARRLGIPAVALAPFHWGQILGAYCQAPDILDRLQAIYAGAEAFLQTSPFVPMPDLGNTLPVGPICATAMPRRREVRAALGVANEAPVALVAMGGFGGTLPVAEWPRFPGWTLITCGPDQAGPHPDMVRGDGLPFSFTELVASVDVVITKPGYGTVTEAACAGTAILYRMRNDWPETPHMMGWAGAHVPVAEMTDAEYQAGDFIDKLQALLQVRGRCPASPTGAAEAAAVLARYL